MTTQFDAVVLGMGPGGEVAADRLMKGGRSVAVVERELIGGECAYWACIPSKTLLRPPEVHAQADRVDGVANAELRWQQASEYRDFMIRGLDDAKQVKSYGEQGATVFKGTARIVERGVVDVDGQTISARDIVIATGSTPVVPPIEGLHDVPVWTNREATTLKDIPERTIIIGGGAVGVELGQMLARFGSKVSIVHRATTLVNREEPRVGELIAGVLEEDGIELHLGREAVKARKKGEGALLELDDGTTLTGDVVILGTGRAPAIKGLGLEAFGIADDAKKLPIDDGCKLADGLWAVGDVTGEMLFTHVAKYQGRIAASNILGKPAKADYRSIPRVIFSDPEIAAVGLTEQQAVDSGLDVATATVDLPSILARPWTYEKEPKGELGLLLDRGRRVLVGAWAVAPMAGEWIHQAALAIRAEIPIEILLDSVAQFPTYSESYFSCLEKFDL